MPQLLIPGTQRLFRAASFNEVGGAARIEVQPA
jgi:hypothetical protein